ncbi:MAG: hypothetical protein AB1758_31915 [Candidatus Eremiobacterota bacterium]
MLSPISITNNFVQVPGLTGRPLGEVASMAAPELLDAFTPSGWLDDEPEPVPVPSLANLGQASFGQLQALSFLFSMLQALVRSSGLGAPAAQEPETAPDSGPIELQQGETYTTPSGSTISFKGTKVEVHETGESAAAAAASDTAAEGEKPAGFCLSASASASASSSGGAAASAAASACIAAGPALPGPAGASAATAAAAAQERAWRVYGDPHIKHPDGSKSDFDRKNGLFTLQDGTRVLMIADNPRATVNSVRIFPPGTRVRFNPGEAEQTSVMQDRNGRFVPLGPASQVLAASH